ncbi:MAG: DUF4139 domain-containing protein [Leptospiraceae bacterium]|nr:DUF4139 domain-containing protein [Leptospiraceae bacterium]
MSVGGKQYKRIPFRFPILFYLIVLPLLGFGSLQSEQPNSATDDAKSVESTIGTVHVFDGQALLLRSAQVDLKKGRHRLAFTDLPQKLLDPTARLRLPSNSQLRLLDLRVETVVEKQYRTDDARKAEEELKAAEQELREVTALYLAQVEQRKSVSGIDLKGEKEDRPIIAFERWKSIFGFVDSSLTEINARINNLLGRIDQARRRLEIALTVAERFKSQQETERKSVIVEVEAPADGRYDLALEYGVADAGWYPHYRLTLEEARSARPSILLASAVYVYNETGEDWRNAKITLSTANLTNPSRLPELSRWTIASVIRPQRETVASNRNAPAAESDYYAKDEQASSIVAQKTETNRGLSDDKPQKKQRPAQPQKAQEQQQRLDNSVIQSRSYYEKNLASVKEDLADQKAKEARDLMQNFRESVNKQEEYYNNRDYNNARQYSSQTLDIIKRLSADERKQFKDEIKAAEKIQSWSYEMEQTRKLKSRLVAPGSQVPGDFSVSAPLAASIASDGILRSIFLSEHRYEASLSYEVSLNESPRAYLTAAIKYTGSQALLAGPVDVYYGPDFGGTSRHPMVSARETYDLNLGRDPDIEISRQDGEFETTEGLFGGKRAVRRTIEFTIHNRRPYEIAMVLYGAIPRSADDRISIENVAVRPEPVDRDDNGIVKFKLSLKAGQKETVHLEYQLIHDRSVVPVLRNQGGSR